MRRLNFCYFIPILLLACSQEPSKDINIKTQSPALTKSKVVENPLQYELSESSQLQLIKSSFYKNKNGYLYQKTIAQRNINGKLQNIEYFNGVLPQDIDPMTFKKIGESWFAKDKNQIYVSRPTSGGRRISKINQADLNSFQPLDYNLAFDKNHYFKEGQIIENFNPNNTQVIKDSQGKIIALQSNNTTYRLDD